MNRATILANRTQLAMAIKDYKPFQFKEFSISQQYSAMKVGTDSILLGAWASVYENSRILDIGTGTGLLSIMLAQKVKGNCTIDAIEIDSNAVKEAKYNVLQCPWKYAINVYHTSLQDYYSDNLYDAIISNPPFYQGMVSSDNRRNKARNTSSSLGFKTLLNKASELLSNNGTLYLIIPYESLKTIKNEAIKYDLKIEQKLLIRPVPDKQFNRILIKFKKTKSQITPIENELCIQKVGESYSNEFITLTKSFYLHF